MPKVMNINIAIDLSDNEWDAATQMVTLKPLVEKFSADLNAAGIKVDVCTNTKGAKRGRKPKAPSPPVITTSTPDEEEAA